MRKSAMYRCALAALAAGAMSNTAYAASIGTCNIPGGQAVVIGGSNQNELREVLGQLQGSLGGACSGNLSQGSWNGGNSGNSSWGNAGGGYSGNSSWGNAGGGCSGNSSLGNGSCSGNVFWGSLPGNTGGCFGNLPSGNFGGCLWDFPSGGRDENCPGMGNTGEDSNCGQTRPEMPDKPVNPDRPVTPDKPVNPDKPVTPDKPVNPDKPVTPDKPVNPDKPVTPDKPVNPDKPVTPDKPVNPDQPDKPEIPDNSQDAYASQVVSLVNAERARAGLPALKVHSEAESAALLRAKEIERNFSHTRPNGSSFSTVLTSAGIRFQSAGENIAYGQRTPAMVMNDWMNSSGHRANIMNGNFTSIAVGHYQNSAGVDYWVQLFLR